jgi:hypothetical protein
MQGLPNVGQQFNLLLQNRDCVLNAFKICGTHISGRQEGAGAAEQGSCRKSE